MYFTNGAVSNEVLSQREYESSSIKGADPIISSFMCSKFELSPEKGRRHGAGEARRSSDGGDHGIMKPERRLSKKRAVRGTTKLMRKNFK